MKRAFRWFVAPKYDACELGDRSLSPAMLVFSLPGFLVVFAMAMAVHSCVH